MSTRISGCGGELPREEFEARRKDLVVIPQSLGLDLERLDLGRFFARDTGTEPSSTSAGTSRRRTDPRKMPSWRATEAVAAVRGGADRNARAPVRSDRGTCMSCARRSSRTGTDQAATSDRSTYCRMPRAWRAAQGFQLLRLAP